MRYNLEDILERIQKQKMTKEKNTLNYRNKERAIWNAAIDVCYEVVRRKQE